MTIRKRFILFIALLFAVIFAAAVFLYPAQNKRFYVQMYSFNRTLEKAVKDGGFCRTTYEIFPYSFCDSDGDGTGDLNGIAMKLEYIEDMGFDQIWLTPVHPSPSYHKYDVADYLSIDPSFGTIDDYESLIADCHKRGITVLMDLVVNHTSDSHDWFRAASDYLHELPHDWLPDTTYCRYFDYYNFSREPMYGYSPLPGTNWYYESRFWSGMPDLNLNSNYVRDEITDIVSFWLEKGVDGFRLDAVTSYHTGQAEANRDFLEFFCETCRKMKPDCYIVGEAWTGRDDITFLYTSGIDSLFNFPFSGPEGVIGNVMQGEAAASDLVVEMIRSDNAFSGSNPFYTDAPFYTNHDTDRSAGYYTADTGPVTKLAYAVSLLMSGNSFLYYGEEIGMLGAGKDENKRAPMYWSNDPSDTCVCSGPPGMDEIQMKFPPLEEQRKDAMSLWNYFRQVIKVRNAFPAILYGKTEDTGLCTDSAAVFYKRCDRYSDVLIVINTSDKEQQIDLSTLDPLRLSAVLNTSEKDVVLNGSILTVPAYNIAVLTEN